MPAKAGIQASSKFRDSGRSLLSTPIGGGNKGRKLDSRFHGNDEKRGGFPPEPDVT
jgi:hypothetical protein